MNTSPSPRVEDFDFDLPPERIAFRPVFPRHASRLMHLPRDGGAPSHHRFTDLPDLLRAGDLLVLNDTRVFPARIRGTKPRTGGAVELLLLEEDEPGTWQAMAKGRLRKGDTVELAGGLSGRVEAVAGDGFYRFCFDGADVQNHLEQHGEMPLPPYIGRAADAADRETYQTVFARHTGSVAAPTSGLHVTDEVRAALDAAGVEQTFVTLHVGAGTFLPVRTECLDAHLMHAERYDIPEPAARAIRAARERGGRLIACGTTVTRALETAAHQDGTVPAGAGNTRLFIRPGYRFRVVDGLVTNFHLPRSTLLMLVAALAGRERVLSAYAEAVANGYRFFSYGDAMLVL